MPKTFQLIKRRLFELAVLVTQLLLDVAETPPKLPVTQFQRSFPFSHAFARAAFLFGLDCFPVAEHLGGVASLRLAEHMRMSPHHLRVHFIYYVVDIELAAFFRYARKESDLKE